MLPALKSCQIFLRNLAGIITTACVYAVLMQAALSPAWAADCPWITENGCIPVHFAGLPSVYRQHIMADLVDRGYELRIDPKTNLIHYNVPCLTPVYRIQNPNYPFGLTNPALCKELNEWGGCDAQGRPKLFRMCWSLGHMNLATLRVVSDEGTEHGLRPKDLYLRQMTLLRAMMRGGPCARAVVDTNAMTGEATSIAIVAPASKLAVSADGSWGVAPNWPGAPKRPSTGCSPCSKPARPPKGSGFRPGCAYLPISPNWLPSRGAVCNFATGAVKVGGPVAAAMAAEPLLGSCDQALAHCCGWNEADPFHMQTYGGPINYSLSDSQFWIDGWRNLVQRHCEAVKQCHEIWQAMGLPRLL